MSAPYLEWLFPGLKAGPYEVTSPEDDAYNCIAWAAGDSERWWSPTPGYYWPGAPRDETVEAFTRVFEGLGYEPCGSAEWEPDYEKVAVYAQGGSATHVAHQTGAGRWTSKCGGLEDISHSLSALDGDEYGTVVAVLRRPRRPDAS